MVIEVAKDAGFCFGVQRAVDIAFNLGYQFPNKVFTLGPIIHNPQVVRELEKSSVHMIEDLQDIKTGIIIVRSHGLPPKIIDQAKIKGLKVVDATCPFVKKVQTYAISLKEEGYPVFLIGDKEHPEVIAIRGYIDDDMIICNSLNELKDIVIPHKLGIVAQTTQDYKNFKRIVSYLLNMVREIKIYNTICDSTVVRQKSARRLAKRSDLMLVIGGKNSANTNRLAYICDNVNKDTYLIETDHELKDEWFHGISKVGITAGASTPKWIIESIIKKIKFISKNN